MEEIYGKIEKYNDDEDVIEAYDYELRQQTILESKQKEALEQGIEQGLEQGLEQGIKQGFKDGIKQEKIEIAKEMLKKEMDISLISELTKLSIQELKDLL